MSSSSSSSSSVKTILITGSTDGLGLATARSLLAMGHRVLLHGRSAKKVARVARELQGETRSFVADLSSVEQVERLAREVSSSEERLDVLVNNAGVFKVPPSPSSALDVRFMVNTVAPYLLTKQLMPLLESTGGARVINLSSAAQAPVDLQALEGGRSPPDASSAYAQSKLALTMWSKHVAAKVSPVVVAVNPGSFLGTKMVKEAYGSAGQDISIGSSILVRAALSEEFASASGRYFDNDSGHFASPHRDAMNAAKCAQVVAAIERVIEQSRK